MRTVARSWRSWQPVVLAALAAIAGAGEVADGQRFERVHALASGEGVFAYARISPDGNTLAYASETRDPQRPRAITQTVTVVDLQRQTVVFREIGIDPYWSNDGARMIYSSFIDGGVSIRHHATGKITRNVAPDGLGDYYSWAVRDGRDLILTIDANYYYLDGDKAAPPFGHVSPCPSIGPAERPLISHDGRRISTFVRGRVVVRGLTDCENIIDTGLEGAKADFSWDGRYLAFHTLKSGGSGYEIVVVDLERRTVRRLGGLSGSSYFPSWTRDGRLSFRYDGTDYQGFMMASDVLKAAEQPISGTPRSLPARRTWGDIFPETPLPATEWTLVLVWGTWSAHSPIALEAMEAAAATFQATGQSVRVLAATEPASKQPEIDALVGRYGIALPHIALAPERFWLTEGHNQNPTTLLFRRGELVDRRMGAQTAAQLRDWLEARQKLNP